MKSGAIVLLGAVCVAVVGVITLQRFRVSRPRAPQPAVQAPTATPPGITMQIAGQRIVFGDAGGMTLYTHASDTVGRSGVRAVSACVGDCTKTWRPAVAAHETQGASDWSVLERAHGSKQWCYRGTPLYAFAGDEAPGDLKGQGLENGAWQTADFLPEVGTVLPDSITIRHLPDAGGTALASLDGLTLYALEDPTHPPATSWRPFEAGAMASPAGDFAVIARRDGLTQWAFRGQPLYLFEGDRKPGEVRGIGMDDHLHVVLIRRYFMPPDAAIRSITGLGNALATRSGATLYERDRVQPGEDNHDFHSEHGPPALGRWYGTSTCEAKCTKTWPPYAAPADAVASGYWEVVTRPDGDRQWAYRGFALYTYSGDVPGEARGNHNTELVRIDDAGPGIQATNTTRAPLQLSARDEAAYVKFAAPGNAAALGVGALFWHAVVP